jgi:hypothetical protein
MPAINPGSIPTGTNTYIPSHEATNNMVVDFSRNPDTFPLSKYSQYVPVTENLGRYIEMTVEMAGRIINSNGADMAWPDGVDAPSGAGNREFFQFKGYQTKRYASAFSLGELAAEQAAWDVLAQYARIHAQRMMTLRTQLAVTALAGTAWGANTSAVSSIAGVTGKWDVSTTARKDIKKSLDFAFEIINIATLGAVKQDQMLLLMSPTCARLLSASQEIVDHIKGSPFAKEEIEGGLGNAVYGLPSTLYGFPVVVEDAVKVTSRKGNTKAASYVLGATTPYLLSRPGELEGVEGAPSFSTLTTFLKEELTLEQKHERDDRKHVGRCVDDTDTVVTAPISGFAFTAAVQ